MFYKNTSMKPKTFHGVTFKPGEAKDVSKYINDPTFIRVNKPTVNSKKAVSDVSTKESIKEVKSIEKPVSSKSDTNIEVVK